MPLRQRPEVQAVSRGSLSSGTDGDDAAPHQAAQDRPPRGPLHAAAVAGSLVAMFTMALAQPLLDLIGRNAAFLVAHDATRFDVIGLGVGLPIVVPLVAAGLVIGLRRLSRPLALGVHLALMAALSFLLGLVVMNMTGLAERLPALVVLAIAAALAVIVPILYSASPVARRGFTVAAIAGPAVAGLFLLASPASALVLPDSGSAPLVGIGEDAPPVVVAFFDELPVASLLTPSGDIDAESFPGFAQLAEESTFYRNASSVHGQTSDAMPAALTGKYPERGALPVAADHPNNLFSLLGGSYDFHVLEPMTELCSTPPCHRDDQRDPDHYATLLRDLTVVGSHLVLPPALAKGLPPIDQGWRDFRTAAAETTKETAVLQRFRKLREQHPAIPFQDWIDGIAPAAGPTLHFGHVLLPHSPWRYLADGREYDVVYYPAGLDRGRWGTDEWIVAQAYQRHLVQAQLADRLLEQLIDRLKTTGVYDDCLLIVLADHGASVSPGESMRVISTDTFGEIAAVPFFVKTPGQTDPGMSDLPVETVDLLPTVLDGIGATPPTGIDGRSVFDKDLKPRANKRFFWGPGVLEFPANGFEKWPVVDRKHELFSRSDAFAFPFGLAPAGYETLLGRQVPAGMPAAPEENVALLGVPPPAPKTTAATVPAHVSGVLLGPVEGRPAIAAAVDGRIAAITLVDAVVGEEGGRGFRMLLPPEGVPASFADVSLYLADVNNDLTTVAIDTSALPP